MTFMTGIIKKKKRKDIQSLRKICGTKLQFTYTVYSHSRTGQAGLGFNEGTRNIFVNAFLGK